MPEISETCEFEAKADEIELITKTNGDAIKITGLHLTQEQASSLAWLINDTTHDRFLEVEIKVKT